MFSSHVSEKENRRAHRVSLSLPVRVEAQIDPHVSWSEVTRLSDVSAYGAGFTLKRPVKRGRLILMTMPLPRQLRCYDFMEPQYKVWGLIRRCVPAKNAADGENYAHGVAFIGKEPPESYLRNPASLYDISHREDEESLWHVAEAAENPDEAHLPREERRHSRFPIPVTIYLETLDNDGNVTASETTVTENISYGGAAILTMLDMEVGSFLRVTSNQYGVAIISVVRGKRVGADGISRLHIEFIDHFFPLEGIE